VCDGRVIFVSDNVDYNTYVATFTKAAAEVVTLK
jgi:pimeloyl-CoA synthetase